MSLTVHVWSDIACPWCYVGKRRLESAIEALGEPVAVRWHSFELDPNPSARKNGEGYVSRLATKYGVSVQQAQGMIDNMTAIGRAEGIAFDFARAVPSHTFDAHRLSHLAADRRCQDRLEERLFHAHFCEGVDVGKQAELTRLAADAGLDVDEVASVFASDRYAEQVRADEDEARALGVTGVPFFVIGRYGVGGAQPPDQLLKVLERARLESEEPSVDEPAEGEEGATCGPTGC